MMIGIRGKTVNQLVRAALVCVSFSAPVALAVDIYEPDNDLTNFTNFPYVVPGHSPLLRDLQSISANPDVDMVWVAVRPNRSYEVLISTHKRSAGGVLHGPQLLQRLDINANLLQSGSTYVASQGTLTAPNTMLRWLSGPANIPNGLNVIRIDGLGTFGPDEQYTFSFRETTLYCPRFNNTNGQVSVLIIQPILEGATGCDVDVNLRNEAGGVVGTLPQTVSADGTSIVISTPTLSPNQRGSATVMHTCGYGNVKAKLVALEPATGFSFDTPCSMREQ